MDTPLSIPCGLPQILQTYGNPMLYADNKPQWELYALETRPLSKPLPYAYGPVDVTKIRAHRLVIDELVGIMDEVLAAGVDPHRIAYGGCYSWRPQRGGLVLSCHTWGIAVDLDPENNPQRKPWDGGVKMMPPAVINAFTAKGWLWGGKFHVPDCMHFQRAVGY